MAELTVRAGTACDDCIESGDELFVDELGPLPGRMLGPCAHAPAEQQRGVIEIVLDEEEYWATSLDDFGNLEEPDLELVRDGEVRWRLVDGILVEW